MAGNRTLTTLCGALLTSLLLTPAQAFNLNESVRVTDGGESGGHSTINGSITVGADATVTGKLKTVNGTIRIGRNSRVEDAKTVNGSVRVDANVVTGNLSSVNGGVRLAEKVTTDGEISVVNGRIEIARGSKVSGDVSNVNGEIRIIGAALGGDLSTVNGDVSLSEQAVVSGDLVVKKTRGRDSDQHRPKIIIGPGSRVEGRIELEREVRLYISESATVGGVTGVMGIEDAVRFKGKYP